MQVYIALWTGEILPGQRGLILRYPASQCHFFSSIPVLVSSNQPFLRSDCYENVAVSLAIRELLPCC